MPTQIRLKKLLSYDPNTGLLTWKVNKGTAKAGEIAGSMHCDNTRRIRIDGKNHLVHRIIWLFMTGHNSSYWLSHINQDHGDNAWANIAETNIKYDPITYKNNHISMLQKKLALLKSK